LRCQQGDPQAGLELFDRAIAARPVFVDALNSRGNALRELGRTAEALDSFDRALAIEPRNADALYNSGTALQALNRHPEALERLQRALAAAPKDVHTLNDIGVSLRALGRDEEALERFERVLRLSPDYPGALSNRGNALKALGRPREAIAAYRQALAVDAGNPDIHHNLSLALLASGEWEEGWREYALRHGAKQYAGAARYFTQPLWRGDADLAGRTILLYAEQGFGDTMMFARYVPLVARRGARVVLEVQPRLATLFQGLEGVAQLVAGGEPLPEFDLQCPLPSLPLAFGTTRQNVPAPIPYSAGAGPGGTDWNAMLAGVSRPQVGIVWSGNPGYNLDRSRSIDLAALEPVLSVPGVGFVSLQKEVSSRDAELLARRGIPHSGPAQQDFRDAAALVAQLDLVLSVDTSVAHLAGSVGKPLWMMLAQVSDWRWGNTEKDGAWYPQARQFRQARRGDWSAPVARIAEALARLA
jgi:tetratricopeptide (TPR) repeat protein